MSGRGFETFMIYVLGMLIAMTVLAAVFPLLNEQDVLTVLAIIYSVPIAFVIACIVLKVIGFVRLTHDMMFARRKRA